MVLMGSAKADIARRRHDVARWLSRAVSSGVIVVRLMSRYSVSRRTAEHDLGQVRRQWIEQLRREEPERRAVLLGTLDEVLHGAIADHAWSAAARAASEIAKLCGCHADQSRDRGRSGIG